MLFRISTSRQRYQTAKKSPSRGSRFRLLMLVVPLILWFGYKQIASQMLPPQAILVLGGSAEREKFAAEFARQHPNLNVWVSSGSPKNYAESLFTKARIRSSRLHLDYEAVDTVTNFTTLVDKLQAQGIDSVYLITSDYHMRRASVIGEIVLGSRGITFKPIAVPSKRSPEPIEKSIRDGARAILWVTTGYTGVSIPNSSDELKKGL